MTIAITLILAAAAYRLLPDSLQPWNFAPIGALALCGGMYLGKRYALLLPLGAMLLSDLFLGFDVTSPAVYACFVVSGLIGLVLRERRRPAWIAAGTLGGAMVFFVVTNFAHWLLTEMYAKSFDGLMLCYVNALPFLRGTLLGDVLFVTAFVCVMELVARKQAESVHA
jgi:hypothetical protein